MQLSRLFPDVLNHSPRPSGWEYKQEKYILTMQICFHHFSVVSKDAYTFCGLLLLLHFPVWLCSITSGTFLLPVDGGLPVSLLYYFSLHIYWLMRPNSSPVNYCVTTEWSIKPQTCLMWKSPFLSQLGMGMVKRSSCVRVFEASRSNALWSSARHGAFRSPNRSDQIRIHCKTHHIPTKKVPTATRDLF